MKLNSIAIGICVIANFGCALFTEKAGPKPDSSPRERVFVGELEEIWRATSMALQIPTFYPLRVSNMETGTLETEAIKGANSWRAPLDTTARGSGYSSRLIVRVIKGSLTGKSAYKVIIQKEAQLQRDFFSPAETVISDGLEEKVLLYRIERELQIDRGLKRASKKQNQSET